jgi:hypothetical protein
VRRKQTRTGDDVAPRNSFLSLSDIGDTTHTASPPAASASTPRRASTATAAAASAAVAADAHATSDRVLSYRAFINDELVQFARLSLARSVPRLLDGLKPGQRKVLFACFKRRLYASELKVAQLTGVHARACV